MEGEVAVTARLAGPGPASDARRPGRAWAGSAPTPPTTPSPGRRVRGRRRCRAAVRGHACRSRRGGHFNHPGRSRYAAGPDAAGAGAGAWAVARARLAHCTPRVGSVQAESRCQSSVATGVLGICLPIASVSGTYVVQPFTGNTLAMFLAPCAIGGFFSLLFAATLRTAAWSPRTSRPGRCGSSPARSTSIRGRTPTMRRPSRAVPCSYWPTGSSPPTRPRDLLEKLGSGEADVPRRLFLATVAMSSVVVAASLIGGWSLGAGPGRAEGLRVRCVVRVRPGPIRHRSGASGSPISLVVELKRGPTRVLARLAASSNPLVVVEVTVTGDRAERSGVGRGGHEERRPPLTRQDPRQRAQPAPGLRASGTIRCARRVAA